MILKKIHENFDGNIIIALCDNSLKGKIIEDDDMQLDLSTDFYSGEESPENFGKKFSNANSINAVGEESIRFLVEKGIISDGDFKKLNKVPYVFIILK